MLWGFKKQFISGPTGKSFHSGNVHAWCPGTMSKHGTSGAEWTENAPSYMSSTQCVNTRLNSVPVPMHKCLGTKGTWTLSPLGTLGNRNHWFHLGCQPSSALVMFSLLLSDREGEVCQWGGRWNLRSVRRILRRCEQGVEWRWPSIFCAWIMS